MSFRLTHADERAFSRLLMNSFPLLLCPCRNARTAFNASTLNVCTQTYTHRLLNSFTHSDFLSLCFDARVVFFCVCESCVLLSPKPAVQFFCFFFIFYGAKHLDLPPRSKGLRSFLSEPRPPDPSEEAKAGAHRCQSIREGAAGLLLPSRPRLQGSISRWGTDMQYIIWRREMQSFCSCCCCYSEPCNMLTYNCSFLSVRLEEKRILILNQCQHRRPQRRRGRRRVRTIPTSLFHISQREYG